MEEGERKNRYFKRGGRIDMEEGERKNRYFKRGGRIDMEEGERGKEQEKTKARSLYKERYIMMQCFFYLLHGVLCEAAESVVVTKSRKDL